MNEQDRGQEQERLKTILAEVALQLTASELQCSVKHEETRDTLRDYWGLCGGNTADEAQLVEAASRQKALSTLAHAAPLNLRKLLETPYFGRIDFLEDEEVGKTLPEKIYVGLASLKDAASGEFLVYDWRAPVAGMFYDFGRGRAWYDCPAGKIEGTIELKRQYRIKDGRLEFMFDADLKIDDEFLQEILGKSVDDKMHTIVNSIQREQNCIIRDAAHRALFVEGPAGSGKTSVALHRIAFLLYRERANINEKNVLILSPNHVFSDYISNVLPEMGEKNVLQLTFQDYAVEAIGEQPVRFETRSEHLEVVLAQSAAKSVRAANISFKSSGEWEKILEAYLIWLENCLVDDYPEIALNGKVIFSRDQWLLYYKELFAALPGAIRLKKIRELIRAEIRPLIEDLRAEKEAALLHEGKEVNLKTAQAMARIAVQQELSSFNDRLEKLTRLNPLEMYRRLFKGDWLERRFRQSAAFPGEWVAIKKQTLNFLHNGIITNEDLAPFLYFQGRLNGFAARREIRHLIIDEAQDYTSLQFKILKALFPECSWTVVGDTAQAVHPFLKTADFTTMHSVVAEEKSQLFRLQRSYRSTREIQTFCASVLGEASGEAVNRAGKEPEVLAFADNEALEQGLLDAVLKAKEDGWRSVGIICKNIAACRRTFAALEGKIGVRLAVDEESGFYRGCVVLPSYLAKGLEFDVALIVDADAKNYGLPGDRKLLYTVCTRALHELRLFHCAKASPFLPGAF